MAGVSARNPGRAAGGRALWTAGPGSLGLWTEGPPQVGSWSPPSPSSRTCTACCPCSTRCWPSPTCVLPTSSWSPATTRPGRCRSRCWTGWSRSAHAPSWSAATPTASWWTSRAAGVGASRVSLGGVPAATRPGRAPRRLPTRCGSRSTGSGRSSAAPARRGTTRRSCSSTPGSSAGRRRSPTWRRPSRPSVCGHTHMPYVRLVGRRLVVNPGSIGMPYGRPAGGRGVGLTRGQAGRGCSVQVGPGVVGPSGPHSSRSMHICRFSRASSQAW